MPVIPRYESPNTGIIRAIDRLSERLERIEQALREANDQTQFDERIRNMSPRQRAILKAILNLEI